MSSARYTLRLMLAERRVTPAGTRRLLSMSSCSSFTSRRSVWGREEKRGRGGGGGGGGGEGGGGGGKGGGGGGERREERRGVMVR